MYMYIYYVYKVCTAQYFTWFLCLIPVALQDIKETFMKIAIWLGLLWVITISIWLYIAYQIEFNQMSLFLELWIVSILLHFVHIIIIICIIIYIK
jgi:phosphatidylinositol glycan class M